jgi:WD40 repeat protein
MGKTMGKTMVNNMENNLIDATLSTQNLTFTPGTTPATFTVTVNNDSSEFANFQIEITAAGEQRNSEYRWYKLEGEMAAAQPPGSSTDFQAFILNTPIIGFSGGTVNLTVRIFSPQLRRECRLMLRLKIERDNQPILLNLELPVREFPVYPCHAVDIPVRVKNLGQQTTIVTLRFVGVDSSWLIGNAERRFSLDPGDYTAVTFQCQPPSVVQSLSQNYPFTIEAKTNNGHPGSVAGNITVLPVGFVDFSTTNKCQKIPSQSTWLPNWKCDTATFELIFKNVSNLYQEININIHGRDWRKCTYKTVPETASLHLGETTKVLLNVQTKRPWVGITKTLLLEARAELSDQRLGTTNPATQTLELQRLPIIPIWLQFVVLGLIALLLALLLMLEPIMHTGSVTSVVFSGNGYSVISGSSDCTLRVWNINHNNNSLEPGAFTYPGQPNTCGKTQTQKPNGLRAITTDSVEVLRLMPVNNDRVAVGLKNGVIELWDVSNGKKEQELKVFDEQELKDPKRGDRVFGLAFTKNSLHLFSGYGSGKLRLWSKTTIDNQFQPEPQQVINLKTLQSELPFEARSLALSPDDQMLVIAGNYKRFLFGSFNPNLPDNQLRNLLVRKLENTGGSAEKDKYVWAVDFVPKSPEKILATGDSGGYINIWNLNQCQIGKNASDQNQITEVYCQPLDSWQVMSGKSVRTLKFSEDGHLLASGGDNGEVIVWHLTEAYKLDKTKAAKGQMIYQSSKKSGINSVDLKNNMIVSGGEDFQVKLNPVK